MSYNEINKILGIPKSTLSNWLSKIPLSLEAKTRLENRVREGGVNAFVKHNKQQTFDARIRAKTIREAASWEVGSISNNDLLIVGAVLYWAEGYKRIRVIDGREITSHRICFTNSDPFMVSVFILFLRKTMEIPPEKISIEMRLFEHMNAEETILYWMKVTNLPRSQFKKPTYPVSSASKGIRPINRLPYGTVQVIVSDTKLFYRVMGFIDGVKERLKEMSVYDE